MRTFLPFVLRVVVPLLVGCAVYALGPALDGFPFTRNYVPDLAWAFSFTSALLITWKGRVPAAWLVALAAAFLFFETGQALGIFAGTFDWMDLLCYFLAGATAIILFKTTKYTIVKHASS